MILLNVIVHNVEGVHSDVCISYIVLYEQQGLFSDFSSNIVIWHIDRFWWYHYHLLHHAHDAEHI